MTVQKLAQQLYTLQVKEGSEYDSKVKAKATFEVTPVSAEKTTVTVSGDYTYDGTAKKPAASNIKVTLNGNDVTSSVWCSIWYKYQCRW